MSIMANPQVYVPSAYPSLKPRVKRQRYDKRVLPFPCSLEGEDVFDSSELTPPWPKIGTAKRVGECTRQDPMTGCRYEAWCYEVTLLDGTIVPATQLKRSKSDGEYVLVQDLTYKMLPKVK